MKIALLGGGGFIGSAIADRLLKDPANEVIIIERDVTKPYRVFKLNEPLEWLAVDMQSPAELEPILPSVDILVHLVSTTLPASSNQDMAFDVKTNVIKSIDLLGLAQKHNVQQVIFISSGGTVYGNPRYLPINEEHPTDPIVSYGVTKLAIEKYLQIFSSFSQMRGTILRVSNPYGARQDGAKRQGIIGAFLRAALLGEQVDIWGDGSVIRDYLYVDDVAEAVALSIGYRGPYSVFNIGSQQGVSINELVQLVEEVSGTQLSRRYLANRGLDVSANILSNQRAHFELGWKPKISLKDGIKKTFNSLVEELKNGR